MSENDTGRTENDVRLPPRVRQRVVLLAAEALGVLPHDEVPSPLRRFVHFALTRRTRLAGTPIAVQLATDPLFRERVAVKVVEKSGSLGQAVAEGASPAAADPVEVAALAYLARPVGWEELVGVVDTTDEHVDQAQVRALTREVDRLTTQLDRVKTVAHADVARLRAESAAAKAEADELRSKIRELTKAVKAAELKAQRAAETLATERGRVSAAASTQDADLRRLRKRLADVETELDTARRGVRESRAADETRLWLLLETMSQAAQGLRRELALSPPDQLPADLVAASTNQDSPVPSAPSWAADSPTRLDQLLALPRAHLVVDGYNVTKTAFPDSSLEQQRTRLITGLAGLAAQTGIEVTTVFDGAERLSVAPATPRGVRVLFSRVGQTADEVIRGLVKAEPHGRPVVVISSDREVAEGVRRSGAYAVPSMVLAQRLSRV